MLLIAFIGAMALMSVTGMAQSVSDQFQLPGVVEPTACRVGAVMSGEQFTTTGFSNVRTVGPNAEQVAGFWVVADNFVQNTSVIGAPNCQSRFRGDRFDNHDLNLMGVRVSPTFASADKADVQEIKLVHDVNLNGQYDPLLDQVLQTEPGSSLDSQQGAVFHYGPQAPWPC